MENNRKLRLVAYLRVSSNAQAESDTIEGQRKEIREWAKNHGHRVVEWCEDVAISGSLDTENRPGLRCILDHLEAGKADAIVFTRLDRLARELTVQEGTLALLWRAGADVYEASGQGFVLADDPFDPMRTAMRQMMGVFAQLERGQIRMRLESGRRRKAADGGYAGGAPRFGFVAADHELAVDDREQAVVSRIEAMRADGASYRAIAQWLNDEEIPTKRGGKWHPATVQRIVDAEARERNRLTSRRLSINR